MSKENNYAQLRIRLKYVGLIPYSVLPHERGAIVSAKESWSLDSELGAGDIVAGAVADPRKWKDPPHVAFANLNLDSAGICRFTRQYGAILGSGKSVSEGWDGRIEPIIEGPFLHESQELLRRVWSGGLGVLENSHHPAAEALQQPTSWTKFEVNLWQREYEIRINDIFIYACFLLRNDVENRKTAVCPNKDCAAPYFIKNRSDQEFCSVECRNLANVRRWRIKPSNRRKERIARKQREEK